ncbi:5-oxoprolinase subunit PxpA [Lewinella sp. 4G2]|uniref:5-oxoprolinase subunit PxpA n=1 Tax=Lewinella sp. 4G2 TaxID=1803372 RepID=UPI0007B49ECC|nr:5-oxoprolinase subunit PxpA [Lewinella sp. 4G2]OAV44886.1 hypothetical protein A3850_010455 [Lewinella sp. 4G2]
MILNADLGESWYQHSVGNDAVLMPFLDSCNVACGFHGGDALTMRKTIELALKDGVQIGAHPSYPDRKHFGRRKLAVDLPTLSALLDYQVAALAGMTLVMGGQLKHIKPHGALYHEAAFGEDDGVAQCIVATAVNFGGLDVYGPEGSHLEDAAKAAGLSFIAEGFVDRRYARFNHLVPRSEPNAVLHSTEECVAQALDLARGQVQLPDGNNGRVNVQTLCLHGDHDGAAERAAAIRRALDTLAAS